MLLDIVPEQMFRSLTVINEIHQLIDINITY